MDGWTSRASPRQHCCAPQELMNTSAIHLLINKGARLCVLLLCCFTCFVFAQAEPTETIVNNGSPTNRVDVAIVGDGYTASQMDKYRTDVVNFVQAMFAQDPYREYQRYFNVHRVDVISNQSGADHPERGVFVDTAFDAAYNCSGTQRL